MFLIKYEPIIWATGTYSVLELMLIFEREITYHLLRTYLPSILFVFVAWFSMFVPLNHVPGEVNYYIGVCYIRCNYKNMLRSGCDEYDNNVNVVRYVWVPDIDHSSNILHN